MIELITWGSRTIAVDVIGTFSHDLKAELTDYTIEDGSVRSDHKILGPDTLELEVQQTEHPIDDPQFTMTDRRFSYKANSESVTTFKLKIEQVRTRILSPFLAASAAIREALAPKQEDFTGMALDAQKSEGFSMAVLQTATPRDRGLELQSFLEELWRSSDTCTVTFRGKSHPEMSLIGLTRTWDRPGLTTFSCSFKRLRTATIAREELVDPATLAPKPKKSQGKEGSGETSVDSENPKGKSALKAIFGGRKK